MKYLIALVFLLILREGALVSIPQSQSFLERRLTHTQQQLDGYEFVQGIDSNGGDIGNKGTDLETLREFCDSRSDCLGFNTNGWVKKEFKDRKNWARFSNDRNAGTYVKQELPIKGYEFVQGMDSNGNDIGNKGTSLKDLSLFCDSRPDCLGFNTNGWVKNHFKAYTAWDHFSNDPRAGTYVKVPAKATALEGYSFVQGIDSSGNDIKQMSNNPNDMKKFCDSRSDCVGFNTNGWIKNKLKSRDAWSRFSEDPKAGTYIKLPAHSHASLLQIAMDSSSVLERFNRD